MILPDIKSNRVVQKPWGQEEIFAETKDYVGKLITINPGHRLSLQYHQTKEETITVISGILTISNGEESKTMTNGCAFHVTPGTVHRFCNETAHPVVIAEVSTNYLEDVVRLADDYRR